MHTVIGTFADWHDARKALEQLYGTGFTPHEVSVIAGDIEEARAAAAGAGDHSGEGAAIGAATGAGFGVTGGWIIGLAALAVPGLGPLVAAGPILGALAGLATGAGLGGLIGGMIAGGVPHEEAATYERALAAGHVVVAVKTTDREDEAERILAGAGAEEVHRAAASTATGEPDLYPEEESMPAGAA